MKIDTIKKSLLFFVFFGLAFSVAHVQVKAAVNISNSPATSSTSPRIAVDSQGNIHAIWVELSGSTSGDLFYSRGNRDGTQWTAPVNLSNSNVVYCNSLMLCGIDVDASDRVYVIWADGNQIKLRIYSSGSWGNATVLASGLVFDAPKIAVTPGGDIFAIWWASSTYKIYSRARISGNWENTFEISTEGKGSKFPDIAVGNNFAGASWAEKNAALDIYQAAYVQRGRSWNAPWSSVTLVAAGTLSQKHQMLAFDSNDVVHIIWTTELGGDRIVHYSYRAGSGFTSPVAISNTMLLHYPNLDERNDNLYTCWQVGGYGGGSSIDYNNKIQGAWEGSKSVPGSGGSTFCDVAAAQDGGAIYFVWDGNGEIYVYVKNVQTPNPSISLTPNKLYYAATSGGIVTRSQYVYINHSGSGAKNWTAIPDQSWIQVTPMSGTGSGIIEVRVNPAGLGEGTYSGLINVTDPDAPQYGPKAVNVTLNIFGSATSSPPFGSFDTPIEGSTVSGSIAVTGWALDDIEVKRVEIKREPDPADSPLAIGGDGLVYIGDALFVPASRPDVATLYPTYPRSDWAGWGYMMLTYGLPRKGNGTFRLYAIAEDATGRRTVLGIKQITSDNAHRVKPFGTIDTPAQGEIISGTAYINFGWALTPAANMIPTDGSTIWVGIDSVMVGHPVYNQYRVDVATSFPECLNSSGAVGYFYIDTTKYTNGLHTIGWLVTDNAGNTDGMGSRFIGIQNLGAPASAELESLNYTEDISGRLKIKADGDTKIKIEEMERIELEFIGYGGSRFVGWGRDKLRPLPVGSTLDIEKGIFDWAPGPGFLGKHTLHFAVTNGTSISQPVEIEINIVPKKYEMNIEKKEKNTDRNFRR